MSEKTNWANAFGRSFDSIPAPANRARADLAAVPPLVDDGTEGPVVVARDAEEIAEPAENAPAQAHSDRESTAAAMADALGSPDLHASGNVADLDEATAIAANSETPRSAAATVRRSQQSSVDAGGVTSSGRGRLAREVPSGSGLRLSATQLRSRRIAAKHAAVVSERLAEVGVDRTDLAAELVGDTVRVLVPVGDLVLDRLLDAIADQFSEAEVVEIELTDHDDVIVVLAVVDEEPAKQRAAWVPAGLRERVREHLELTGESVSQLVLKAFNTYHDRLPSMFDASETPHGPLRGVATKRRHGVETPVQLTMYWHRSHEQEIQSAVRSSGARSRSDLITVLLDRYLDDVEQGPGTTGDPVSAFEPQGSAEPSFSASSERVSMLEELEREWESSRG